VIHSLINPSSSFIVIVIVVSLYCQQPPPPPPPPQQQQRHSLMPIGKPTKDRERQTERNNKTCVRPKSQHRWGMPRRSEIKRDSGIDYACHVISPIVGWSKTKTTKNGALFWGVVTEASLS
jgi:hypothetical protein